ncbi:hypothetical protein B0O99DRAFT_356161 [Bisporella sp. PMI_857]|nr:hypothetical protein B0O99DRAFT_356161 [Bisporella sp. PMI_857]
MESTPVPLHSRQRAATLTLDTSRGAGKSPMTGATDNDDNDIMSAPGILDDLSNMSGALPAVVSPVSEETAQNSSQDQSNAPQNMIKSHSSEDSSGEPKVEAKLGVPAPIGKSLPSWDPINATPIAEEEGFHFEQRTHDSELPHGPQQITQPHSKALHLPKETFLSKAPNSRGYNFYDASEESSDLNEWVVVPKQVDSKQDRSGSPPRIPEIAVMQTYFGMEGSHNSNQAPSKVADEAQPASSHRTSGNLDVSHDKIPEDNNLDVASRPRAGSILDRPRYSYDVPRADLVPSSSSWNQNMQTEKHTPFVSSVPAIPSQQSFISTPEDTSKPSAIYSARPSSQQEPLVQPRYSYDVPRASQPSALPKVRTVQPEYRPFPVNTSVQSMQPPRTDEEPQSTTSFKGLPPIRRTSTFGKGFGSRQAKSRFTIDDADPVPNLPSQLADSGRRSAEIAIAAGVATMEGIAHREAQRQSRSGSLAQEDPSSPFTAHAGSSDHSQHTITRPTQSQQLYNAPRAADFPPENEEYRSSQDSWRPNIATLTRTSFEQQQNRQSFGQRAPSHQQSRSFDQPPSSAQRYPSLFRPEQPAFEEPKDGDLPAHYYQAPLAREQVFLPRHQTNEYQLPGVGPPADEPRPSSRRNSGIFKEIGNKIRSASRERGNSFTQDGGQQYYNRYNAEANEYAESSVASEDGQERNKRRNSLFGKLTRASTGLDTPQSRESMVAHTAGSRTGLALTPGQTPVQSPVLGNESKRSFFGDKFGDSKGKLSKPLRASVDGKADDSEKKKSGKRFSNLSNMFGRSKDSPRTSVSSPHPEAMRELSHQERQPFESPAPTQGLFAKPQSSPQQKQNNNSSPKQSSQQRGLLAKLSGAGEPTKDRQESKTRKLSATPGLLSGIMGRRSQQSDKRDDSSSQGTRSQGSQPKEYRPNQVPPARTYTDIAENATPITKQAPNAPWHEENRDMLSGQGRDRNRERGRQTSREPHIVPEPRYDTVPIPGGYNLVRGEGAAAVPTAYDPKGYNQVHTTNVPYTQHGAPTHQKTARVPGRAHVEQQLPPVQTSASYVPAQSRPLQSDAPSSASNNHSSRRLSREDMLARSPAREPNGQQRPYQLSLPEDEEDRQPLSLSMNIPIISPPRGSHSPSSIQVTPNKTPENNSIQRLAQPILRHPESPAGYPLPDDTVFSPINPSASHLPPPPPPKWPEHLDNQDHHHLHLSIDRSDTRRTAVSGISQVSGISGQPSMLVPQASGNKIHDRSGISPSPTPPSPGITPPPQQRSGSPQRDVRRQPNIQTTTLIRNHSPDLYNASPRLPKLHGNPAPGPHSSKENQRAAAISSAQEEKIVADDGHLGLDDNDNEPATMSATSYPGQEWNPYAGVYMEEYD